MQALQCQSSELVCSHLSHKHKWSSVSSFLRSHKGAKHSVVWGGVSIHDHTDDSHPELSCSRSLQDCHPCGEVCVKAAKLHFYLHQKRRLGQSAIYFLVCNWKRDTFIKGCRHFSFPSRNKSARQSKQTGQISDWMCEEKLHFNSLNGFLCMRRVDRQHF